MSGRGLSAGGILAAGDGTRLREDGWTMAKPLVPVAGVPLVAHVVENFLAAGIESLAIIFNAREEDCAEFVARAFRQRKSDPREDDRLLLESSRDRADAAAGPALVSTVDAWCPRPDFRNSREGLALPPRRKPCSP